MLQNVIYNQNSFKIGKINGIEKHGFGVRLRQIHPEVGNYARSNVGSEPPILGCRALADRLGEMGGFGHKNIDKNSVPCVTIAQECSDSVYLSCLSNRIE